nr:alpha/beta fold hydrolase [Massilia rhizosphaerae]
MLDALPVERVIVVGNDWGATIAWQMALMRPTSLQASLPSACR